LKDARRFLEVSEEVTKKKPVVIWKGGESKTGSRVVNSHTGSIAGSAELYSAAFKQTGIIEANGLGELADFALTFSCLQPNNIKNVGVVSGPAGINVSIADSFDNFGFDFPVFSEKTKEELKTILPWFASFSNPTDLTMGTTTTRGRIGSRFELLKNVLSTISKDEGIDLMAIGSGDLTLDQAEILINQTKRSKKPLIVICFPRMDWNINGIRKLGKAGIPVYLSPKEAAKSIKALTTRYKYLESSQSY
jgi:acyl-CoA synthetase (NDP forming)